MNKEDWNQRYRDTDRLWSASPNAFVESELEDLEPGRAIDLAAGEGRNALWLASRGFRVTAVDFSDVAIERGRAAARERGIDIDWVVADLMQADLEERAYDLVLIAYLHLPWPHMQTVFGKAAAAVADGGTFFLIAHDARNLDGGYGGPKSPDVLYSPEAVAKALPGLDVVRAETVERHVATDDGPRTALDCLVRAVRR